MLQIGNVDFDTAAGDDYNFIFAGVATQPTSSTWSTPPTRRGSAEGLGDDGTRARRAASRFLTRPSWS